jgi:hypothetical protein
MFCLFERLVDNFLSNYFSDSVKKLLWRYRASFQPSFQSVFLAVAELAKTAAQYM